MRTRRSAKSGQVMEDASRAFHTSFSDKEPGQQDKATPGKQPHGKQADICQLNLDVLFLIAGYMQPMDLLSLARTCKSLRHTLMDKSSAFIWKAARSQIKGLPDCPVDLAEPEYANLAFDPHCHGCSNLEHTILWEIRRRYCPACRPKRLCLLSSCAKVIRNHDILARERLTVERSKGIIWVDKEHVTAFIHEYKHSFDKRQFLTDRKEQYAAICEHARRCGKWEQDTKRWRQRERTERFTCFLGSGFYAPKLVYYKDN